MFPSPLPLFQDQTPGPVQKWAKGCGITGAYGYRLMQPQLFGNNLRRHQINLVKNLETGNTLQLKLPQQILHHLDMIPAARIADINHMHQHVGLVQFLQSGLERLEQLLWKMANSPPCP